MGRKENIMASDKDRSDRLAAALRANLQRRKAQARARRDDSPAPPPAAPGRAGDASGGNPASEGSGTPPEGKPVIVPDDEAG